MNVWKRRPETGGTALGWPALIVIAQYNGVVFDINDKIMWKAFRALDAKLRTRTHPGNQIAAGITYIVFQRH